MSKTRVIGSGNGMPWEVPHEYQHFLDTTRGQTIIIGRKSHEIFGPTLTSERCFVITRSDRTLENASVFSSLDLAIAEASQYHEKIFVAGGASIYEQAIDRANEMQLSYIKGNFEGDAYFPEFDDSKWLIAFQEDRGDYEFVHYLRNREIAS